VRFICMDNHLVGRNPYITLQVQNRIGDNLHLRQYGHLDRFFWGLDQTLDQQKKLRTLLAGKIDSSFDYSTRRAALRFYNCRPVARIAAPRPPLPARQDGSVAQRWLVPRFNKAVWLLRDVAPMDPLLAKVAVS